MNILVTGCIRSGTAYTTAVLRNLGLDVMHEGSGKDGSVSAFLAKPDVELPPWHGPAIDHYDLVLHQVRHPVAVVASMRPSSGHFWAFVKRHASVRSASLLRRSMEYWLVWNRVAEARAQMTYRIEDAPWDDICRLIGVEYNRDAVDRVATDTNSRQGHPYYRALTWEDLDVRDPALCLQIRQLARRYGYDD